MFKDLNKTYEQIINKVINTKTFKRRRYEMKKDESDRFNGIK
jgi:hypothetical protein